MVMLPVKAKGKVREDASIELDSRFRSEARKYKNKDVEVFIRELEPRRSIDQNAYYWGVVIWELREAFQEAGNFVTMKQTHDFCKSQFAAKTIEVNGEVMDIPGSTAEMDKKEFTQYVERIKEFARDFFDIEIP